MKQYKYKGYTIYGYPAVSLNSFDHCLSGRLGEIWFDTPGRAKAFKSLGAKGEKIFSFDIKDLRIWLKRLDIPYQTSKQVFWANNPNSRSK